MSHTTTEHDTPHTAQPKELRLDDASVAKRIAHYSPEAQDAVMWVAGYIRERCSGRRDLLCDQLDKLGFKETSNNYWYRVLSGKYFEVVRGKVQGSVSNLLQMVDALRARALLSSRAGKAPFIETSTWARIRDYIDLRRAPESVCKFGVIIGPTGGQKTECVKHYVMLNNHGACVHLEAPGGPSMYEFLNDLGKKYTGAKGTTKRSTAALMATVAANVNDTKTIIVDNVQRLYKRGAEGNQPVFNYLQKLQEDTGCTVILMVAGISKRFLTEGLDQGFFEQFEGRAGGQRSFLVLDDYTPREDIKAIAAAYGLDPADKATVKYLEKLSREPGRVRILFHWLQTAKRTADLLGQPLTIEHIKAERGEDDAQLVLSAEVEVGS